MLHHHFLEKDNIVSEIHQEGDNHPEHIQEVDSLQYLETLSYLLPFLSSRMVKVRDLVRDLVRGMVKGLAMVLEKLQQVKKL